MMSTGCNITRRRFLAASTTLTSLSIVPGYVLGGGGKDTSQRKAKRRDNRGPGDRELQISSGCLDMKM